MWQQENSGEMIKLHGYFRSSAAWRVRIALALKGIDYAQRSYQLPAGEQRSEGYLRLNPQGLVPALEIDGLLLTQSLAICEYLDECYPEPNLLGATSVERARIRAFAQAVACDIHPLQNLRVLNRIEALTGNSADGKLWAQEVIRAGFDACARLLPDDGRVFCFGECVSLADLCLIPQMANAKRFDVEISWPNLAAIEAQCLSLPAFSQTAPDKQPDFTP